MPTGTVPSKPGALEGAAEGSPVALGLPDGLSHSEDRQDPNGQKLDTGREEGKPRLTTTPSDRRWGGRSLFLHFCLFIFHHPQTPPESCSTNVACPLRSPLCPGLRQNSDEGRRSPKQGPSFPVLSPPLETPPAASSLEGPVLQWKLVPKTPVASDVPPARCSPRTLMTRDSS